MNLLSIYSHRLTDKRYAKNKLIGLVVYWLVYIVFTTLILNMQWQLTVLAAIVGTLGIIPSLYQLKKGIYLAPGETYKKPASIKPEEFLESVKNGK